MSSPRDTVNPFIMYGTAWKEDNTDELTLLALQSGFRAIDTANQRKHYYEAGVGAGISNFLESTEFDRKDLFLQTKYTYQTGQDHRLPYDPNADYPTQVKQSFESSLEHLNTDYLDSYILHGPSTGRGLNQKDFQVWQAMEELKEQELTKNIGASNINAQQLQLLLDETEIYPKFVQNRCYAQAGWDMSVRQICNENDIIYQGFSLLTANKNYLSRPKIKDLATKYQMPIPALIFAFAVQIGMLPLTGTTQEIHMKQDLVGITKELQEDDLETIEQIAL